MDALFSNPIIIGFIVLIIFMAILKYMPKPKPTYSFIKRRLLTKNEMNFYKLLLPIATKYRLQVLTKVRMADLVQSKPFNQTAFNKIKAKHVDFVLVVATVDNLEVKCIIELDDSSHDKSDAKASDEFKNDTFKSVKIPLIRTRNITGVDEKIKKIVG